MRRYLELFEFTTATADDARTGLMDWFKRFGTVRQWVSDRGTHFKNEMMELLRKRLGGTHHFTTAHCPRANGSVEVVNRLILKCMRAMLSELKLAISMVILIAPHSSDSQ